MPIILWKLESTDAKWSVNIMFSGWVDLPEVVQLGSSMGGKPKLPYFEHLAEEGGWRVAPARTCKHAPSSTFLRAWRRNKGEHQQQRRGKSLCSSRRGC